MTAHPGRLVDLPAESLQELRAQNSLPLSQLAYVNPETGRECLATLGFSALQLRPREELRLPQRSASAILHVVEGAGTDMSTRPRISSRPPTPSPCQRTPTCVSPTVRAHHRPICSWSTTRPCRRKLGIYESHSCIAR